MNNIDITEMSVENRALSGIFVCFQYPVAIPGVSMAYFLRASINAASFIMAPLAILMMNDDDFI